MEFVTVPKQPWVLERESPITSLLVPKVPFKDSLKATT